MKFYPHLSFNGNCREALNYYAELFGGAVNALMPWTSELIENVPGASEEHIMYGSIDVEGYAITGSDQFGDQYVPAGNMSLMVDLDDLSDAEAKFNALAGGGQVIMPFGETFWADGYGFCVDRFGIMWQINCAGSKGQP